jgi:RecA/RadA recombinase
MSEVKTKNKWMKQLQSIDGAVSSSYDAFTPENVIASPSPSLNWVCGKPGGLPKGFSMIAWGLPKTGKSLISYLFAGNLHQTDPDAIVVRFDTEMRSKAQMNGNWGIDYDRFIAIDANTGSGIFDVINGEIKDMLEQGAPIKMIIIDSLQGISGPKETNAESTSDHIIGDNAMTLQRGLKAILPIIRKYNIGLILTAHVRANMDAGMYGPKIKMSGGWYMKHFAEMYLEVSRDNSKDGKVDLLGKSLTDDTVKDFKDNKEITGHKIYVKMSENSLGVAGRSGEFTIDYIKGLVNTHEEVFQLGINTGVVQRPNNRTYVFEDKQFTSKEAFLTAIRDDSTLSKNIINKVHDRDL